MTKSWLSFHSIVLTIVILLLVTPASKSDEKQFNSLQYMKDLLLNKHVWLKSDVCFGKNWMGNRKDCTNVIKDGVWYRSHGIAERDPVRFLDLCERRKWGNELEANFDPHQMYRGEKVRVYEVSQSKQDMHIVYFRAESKLKTGIYFDFKKIAMNATQEEVDQLINWVFAFSEEELEQQEIRTVEIGMTMEEVKNFAGLPKASLNPADGVIVYVYDYFKVIFKDGIVEKIEY